MPISLSVNTSARWAGIVRMGWALLAAGIVLIGEWPARAGSDPDAGRQELLLSGDNWALASFEPGEGIKKMAFAEGYPASTAIPATVPGDVHWDLERAGKVPPIFYGLNSQKIGWVAGREWWYRKRFSVPKEWQVKRVRLRFDAVDYLAEVWLNRQFLGRHEGQFTPFEFDVAEALRPGEENAVTVLIHPAPAKVREAIASGSGEWTVMQAIRSAYRYWKCMTNAGWDWGAKIVTLGIWQDVRLIATEGIYLSDLVVQSQLAPPYDQATLHLRLRLDTPVPQRVQLNYSVRCLTAADPPVEASQLTNIAARQPEVVFRMVVPKPRLWWPNGYGPQPRYELTVTARAMADGKLLDRAVATFGIRDLQMLANPDSPDNVEYIDYTTDQPVTHKLPSPPPARKYLVQINGRRIFARGGNWIPCDLLYGRPRRAFYEHRIRLAALANCNLFRMWGGGLIEKPVFYDLCDHYGIMLFQEFPNAGVRLAETDDALAVTSQETRQILPRLINHPCIVRYGGANEWYRNAQNSRQMAQLRQICNDIDPTRPFHDPDPECIAQRHGPHSYDYRQHYQTYNTGRPLTAGPDNPLEWTEYGASGAASVETLQQIMPPEALWPIRADNPFWIWHKAFGAFGADNWMGSAQYRRLFGELPDLATTVRCSQFVQAEGLRYANQSMRRHEWHRSACAFWTYNEPWPNAAHGCVIEYSGRPKMAYYYAKQSFAPLDISAVYSGLSLETGRPAAIGIWVTSDQTETLSGYQCRYQVLDGWGKTYADKSLAVNLTPESSRKILDLDWTPPAEMKDSVALLYLELSNGKGEVVARNFYTFGIGGTDEDQSLIPLGLRICTASAVRLEILPESQGRFLACSLLALQEADQKPRPPQAVSPPPPPLRALLHAPPTDLRIRLESGPPNPSDAREFLSLVTVENRGSCPALFVKLDAPVRPSVQTYWEDNYLFLRPGEQRIIQLKLVATEELTAPLRPRSLRAEAWNSPPVEVLWPE